MLCRLTDLRCPAEVAGCAEFLTEGDLRGVVDSEDLVSAEHQVQDLDAQNRQLIDELKRQSEEYRPMFKCAICLVEHEVEDCCTLPCQHRFCFESLQYHFEIIVKERRLSKLACPDPECGYSLRSEEHTHMFQQCLSEESYHKLLDFLTRDDPHVHDCKHLGCEEKVFVDDGDDFTNVKCALGHRFCTKCENGPHPWKTCEVVREAVDRERRAKKDEEQNADAEALQNALAMGWKPCPKRCSFGGGVKAEEECDHVTCECGHEFCWACGVTRQVALEHDNRWHKPSCPYHTPYHEVNEAPKRRPNCPECQKMPGNQCCAFPPDDGYPHSYLKHRSGMSGGSAEREKTQLKKPWQLSLLNPFRAVAPAEAPRATARVSTKPLKVCFHDGNDFRTIDFTYKPVGLNWDEGALPLTISGVTPGSPAHKAGVTRGWWVQAVSDENLMVHEFDQAVRILCDAVNQLPDGP